MRERKGRAERGEEGKKSRKPSPFYLQCIDNYEIPERASLQLAVLSVDHWTETRIWSIFQLVLFGGRLSSSQSPISQQSD